MRRELSWLLILVLLCPFISPAAQGLMSLDHTDGLWNTDTIEINQTVTFHIRMNNNTPNNITGSTTGFRVFSPTGAQWNTTVAAVTGAITTDMYDQGIFINEFSVDGMGADTIGFGGFKLFKPGIPAGFDDVVWTLQIGPVDAAYHLGQICLDSSFYPPNGFWKWSTTGGDAYPEWDGPHCYTILDPDAPIVSNLVLSPDSMHFSGMEGSSSPPAQVCNISSDGQPLTFALTEDVDWIVPSPIQGVTPRSVNVQINSTGMTAGTYVDSVLVSSSTASNSPQYLVITLELVPPPPVIGVDPGQFYFNAVAGEANPEDKILTITNVGGSTLDWTVSNTEPWLSLSPSFGGDLGHVTVSVDITGLPFGDYADTIVVSDPNATNSPVEVPVFLSVGSDLPIIEVDSLVNYVVVPTGQPTIPPWTITVRNGGAGGMSFWLEEDSPRLFTLTPSSGTAPQDVEVGFKIAGGTAGVDYYDTLWVYSNEAINSPVPVVFIMHYVDDPALIHPGKDSLRLNVFECDMGANTLMPMDYFLVDNLGGDDPLPFKLVYESDLFRLNYDSAVAPFLITATAKDIQLPLGTYYDTILIVAPKATNSPDTVIVRFDMIAGLVDPEIYLAKDSYVIPTQENAGPTPGGVFEILNRYGGCMEWEIQEDIPWVYPDIVTGNVPGFVGLAVNSSGFPFGQYADSFYVVSPDATNSPRKVSVLMKVWRFHGDWDYNAIINISDLVAMADYLFGGGPLPQPEIVVGDLDCNHRIDVSDMAYFSEYLFLDGPIPCGNPY